MRDITLEDTIYLNFTTRSFSTGIPTVLSGSPALSVIESNNATPITSGVSVQTDRASVVGLNQATVVATAANGYEAGKSYSVYISTGTVGGVSVVGEVVGQFTIQASAAAVDLANATDGLGALKTETAAIKTKTDNLPAAPASTTNITGGTITTVTNLTNAPTAGDLTATMKASVTTAATAATPTAAAVSGAVGSVTGMTASDVGAIKTKTDALPTDPADHSIVIAATDAIISAIAALNDLSQADIRTATGLAAANLDTQLADLPTNAELAAALATADDAVLVQVAAVKAKTDLIPAAPAAVGDIPTAVQVAEAILLRDWTAIAGAVPARSMLNALRAIRNKWSVTAGVMTVTKEDDTTTAWTSALTTDAAADPIIASDPA